MKILVKAVKYNNPEDIKVFNIKLDENSNHNLIIKKLQSEKAKIINYLIRLKEQGIIKSINRPKNKKIKNQLNNLVAVKKIINNSIDIIKEVYR